MTLTSMNPAVPVEQQTIELFVQEVRREADEVISVVFTHPDGAQLPAWEPGAHLDLELPSGLRRQYSLCGPHTDRTRFTIAVLKERESRGGSKELHEVGLVGRVLHAVLRNHFPLVASPKYLFIAGGIGITPILSMIRSLDPDVEWTLAFAGRSRRSMAFLKELAEYGERVLLAPRDVRGRFDLAALLAQTDPATAVYCCGPNSLLDAVSETHERLATGAELHIERFGAATATPTIAPTGAERPVRLELRRTGAVIEVGADCTLLDAIREVVPGMPFSCTEGYCGSCEVAVVEGAPDHRDEILTPQEREAGRTMFPCVSRSLTPSMVIDL